ncbi:hypothetical protein T02_2503 [Trichinella nativa]|uniref:Uncharacterized protein n=1 Tax=Trichinella nativa TaxID=6335 RepID=A0A0V1L8F8_9BILA|nr:hypothetical protein T02_2503 [Trichinella nativa]
MRMVVGDKRASTGKAVVTSSCIRTLLSKQPVVVERQTCNGRQAMLNCRSLLSSQSTSSC